MVEAGTKIFQFCENLLMGMTIPKAAAAAGMTRMQGYRAYKKSEVQAHLETQRHALRRAAMIEKDDVLQGFLDAIRDAKLLSDPGNQIAGWREIARMLGFYEPERKTLELTGPQDEVRQALETLPQEELLKLVGPIEEAEFDFIPKPEAKAKNKARTKARAKSRTEH